MIDLQAALARCRDAAAADLPVSAAVRRDRLSRAIDLLVAHAADITSALSQDFGHRSHEQSLITDVMSSVKQLKHARDNVERWMRPERRPLEFPLALLGARARVEYQPKGVVGIIAPWNFPVNMMMAPLAGAFAAGNRVMIKMSEFTPGTAELMRELIARRFDPAEAIVITGDAAVGAAFAGLPFDHLFFTGSTAVGKLVMRAAADNLVPVTLELGGKSPTIIGRSAAIGPATERIATGKLLNAGQICLAPDYLLVPTDKEADVVGGLTAAAAKLYPKLLANPDYTAVINARHRERLEAHVADARDKGAEVIVVGDGASGNDNRMPLHLIRHVDETMTVTQEEIFGPVMPILTYDRIDQAIDYVNARPRPLALYHFGDDEAERRQVLDRTVSGGVTVNDVIFHIAAEDLPFGGIGPSGMGAYHGLDGFRTFSHAKSVYVQPKLDVTALAGFKPPYGARTRRAVARELKP